MQYVVELTEWPGGKDWCGVKQRALVTIGKKMVNQPDMGWKKSILKARHSPIRRLMFSFAMEIPYYVSVHLARHIHAQPYIKSQRNDRQSQYDRDAARQDTIVNMIWDMNAEELMVIANKRLCRLADAKTRAVVDEMCRQVQEKCPEFEGLLVPMCEYAGCKEMYPCGKEKSYENPDQK